MTVRNYLTLEQLQAILGITIDEDDQAAAELRLGNAEQLIDAYCGNTDRYFKSEVSGNVSAVTNNSLTDTNQGSPLGQQDNYYALTQVTIVGGTGAGQTRLITAHDRGSKTLYIGEDWTTNPDTTSFYKIEQFAKFPRYKDAVYDTVNTILHKYIPEAVKQAVAAQYEFMVAKGDDFFSGDTSDLRRERLNDYEYERGGTSTPQATSRVTLVSPKARTLLAGYMVRTGRLIPRTDSRV